MGKIVTIASHKGGVGKTTTALNFAYSLSRLGGSVLLVDVDPQGGMTVATNVKKHNGSGLVDYLSGNSQLQDVISQTKARRLSIMGIGSINHDSIARLEQLAAHGALKKALTIFAKYYDYVIVDAPAGLGCLPTALLNASDAVILVVQCRSLALKTLPPMLALIDWVQKSSNPNLILEGVLINMYNQSNPTESQMFSEIQSAFPEQMFFTTTIPFDPVFEDISLQSVPAAMHNGAQAIAGRYIELSVEYKQREMLRAQAEGADDVADSGLF